MKPGRALIFVLFVSSLASFAWLEAAESAIDPVTGCSATVPTAAQTGQSVQFQAAGPAAGSVWTTDSIVGNLRFVPATSAGAFTQGEPAAEPCQSGSGQFTHVLTRNLAVMETAVTRQMWATLGAAQSALPADPTYVTFSSGTSDPVQSDTWYEAVLFANLLSVQQGLTPCYYTDSSKTTPIGSSNYNNNDTIYCDFTASGYRLPTEGEREYFTRAGTTGPFSVSEPNYTSGNCYDCTPGLMTNLEGVAWFCANAGGTTHPAGTKAANPWALKDVHGNVWEWCWDWYANYPSGTVCDYAGPATGLGRVVRGGSWGGYPVGCRSANRSGVDPDNRYAFFGFRLLRSL